MATPQNLKFAKSDEWINQEGENGTIGISDYAQDQLSDIVYVEFLKDPGDSISKGDLLATIESVKAAADVIAPASGEVIEVNEELIASPEILNSDPYEKGWMAKIKISNVAEIDELLTAKDYDAFCESR